MELDQYLRDRPVPTTPTMLIAGLDDSQREGWIIRGIPPELGESTWRHSKDLAHECRLYAQFIAPELDRHAITTRALWHDLNDYFGRDITPHENVPPELKKEIERLAVQRATAQLGEFGERIRSYWLETSRHDLPETFLIWQMDKLATVPRALRYKQQFPQLWDKDGRNLREFLPYAHAKLTCPTLTRIADKLAKEEYAQDPVQQYHLLLRLNGDINHFDRIMQRFPDYFSSTVNSRESCTSNNPVRAPASSQPWA